MADVTLVRLDECARWSLRAPSSCSHEFSGLEINRCMHHGERLAARLGPDEWLVFGSSNFENLKGKHHSLVDVSHRYAAFSLDGPQSHLVLAAGCPLDLHPAVFTAGSATRTLLGKAEIILWRLHDAPAYRVECARSYAQYVDAFLREAAREFSPASPEDFFAIGRLAQERIGWKLFTAMRYLPESDEVERVHSSDVLAYPLAGRKTKRDTAWSRRVLLEGEPNFAADADALRAAFDDAETILALGIGALINVPVRDPAGGRVIGTLNFGREAGGYGQQDIARALELAPLAAPLLIAARRA